MVVKKGGLLKSTKEKSPANLSTYRTLCGERGTKTFRIAHYHKMPKCRKINDLSVLCYFCDTH